MVEIRRALVQDFLDIAKLDREVWKDNRHADFIPDGEHVWRIWVDHALVYCSCEKGTVTGAVVAFPALNGSYCLHKVFVARYARGKGTGFALIKELLAEIDRLKADIFLTVDPENANALDLYQSLGFVKKRYVEGYYRQCEDRLVLVRRYRGD